LANERNYHGMLASDLLHQTYTLNDKPYAPSAQAVASVNKDPSVIRARELLALDRIIDARREWMATLNYFNEEQLQAAAKLATQLKLYDRAILTAAKAQNRDDLSVRFPLAYAADMKRSAQKNNISPAWAFAITRQESAFLYDATSSAGAMGLMQLLPSTAQQVAKQSGQSFNKNILTVPAKNIALGTTYLRDMAVKFNKNTVLASAAYNAGATRVYRWLPDQAMPTDIWVETIPFRETRNYVQNVFSYQVIYQNRLGLPMDRLNHNLKVINP
ncbi:MAG TPA: transglycosylase SLT domain-containing protein, partial [Gammaproteobacteria bacterium]|nr:transglycosylase SLT domain-containing protein [Gammaproteobacteria bacterium]